MTIPGIDMVVAVGLLAAIGAVDRFTSPGRLVAFLGLNPSVHQSGNGPARHGRITKQDPCHASTMLVEAAWKPFGGLGHCKPFTNAFAGDAAPMWPPSRCPQITVIVWHLPRRGLRMGASRPSTQRS
jgi:hypothetical protein